MTTRKLHLVTWSQLAAAVGVGAVISGCLLTLMRAFGYPPPTPGWLVSGGFIVVAAGLWLGAWLAHQRFHVRQQLPEPSRGLILVALTKACAVVGAAWVGGYLVMVVINLPAWESPAGQRRVIQAALAAASAVLLSLGGKFCERECRFDHSDHGSGISPS
ncbi:MAG: DUF3180 domain-containing protein [Propionibacteriaceae bacterium]|jgi:hypothetical protein|nr:DUF3180 domain-containing protein [Propionibacteriaceae bacterium]